MAIVPPGPSSRIYSPSELNQEVRLHLEAGFPRLWIQAEISNLARPASGHLYFTLKDKGAQIRAALFRSNALGLGFRPENGQQVLVRGRLSLYEARGDYQLIADAMLEAGAGALQQAFEALKRRLEAEGLFEPARKQPLPRWPRRIAVVTSPSGAAVRDIVEVLAQRWPAAQVRIYASQVQGEAAPAELIRALAAADRHGFAELIILARGGGSLEDLWAFNDEGLARAIAACHTPVISAVGHETDVTIADFVADLRAPTPSAAAMAATPDGPAMRERLLRLLRQLARAQNARIDRLSQGADHLDRRLLAAHPERRLSDLDRRSRELADRLRAALPRRLREQQRQLAGLGQRLKARHPERQIDLLLSRQHSVAARLARALDLCITEREQRLRGLLRALNAVSPLAVLDRGYALVVDDNRQPLVQRADFEPGRKISLLLNAFEVDAEVSSRPRDSQL